MREDFESLIQKQMKELLSRQDSNGHIPMKKFKKYNVGDLVVGYRKGSASDLRIGRLVRGYYTVNYPFLNCAWVIKCEDGKERSYQGIHKIESKEEEREIRKERERYLERRNR